MNIADYCDVLNLELRVLRYPNQNGRWCARFERCETKDAPDSGVLASPHGNGKTPEAAISDYTDQIRGKILVVDAMGGSSRREYGVPVTLES